MDSNFKVIPVNMSDSVGYILILQYEYILIDPPAGIIVFLQKLNFNLMNVNTIILTSNRL
jgi:hypothetical protein